MKTKALIDSIITETGDLPGGEVQPQSVVVHLPVNVRNASMVLIAVLITVFILSWAKAVFIPILLGVMASYALTPIVDRLQQWRIPRVLAAAVLLSAIVGSLGWTAYRLGDDAIALLESLPEVAHKFREVVKARESSATGPVSTMGKVQQAATEFENASDGGATKNAAAPRGVTKVQIEKPKFNVQDYVVSGTLDAVAFIGQATACSS